MKIIEKFVMDFEKKNMVLRWTKQPKTY
jgi:hypothetical protein